MRKEYIGRELEDLYEEQADLKKMTDKKVCELYDVVDAAEVRQQVDSDIKNLENELKELEDEEEDDGMDYIALQQVQGMAIANW